MTQEIVLGWIRHLLTTLGGGLIAKGVTDQTGWERVVGAIITIIGFAWSWWHKKGQADNKPLPPTAAGG